MLPYSWADMKEELLREAKKIKDIPNLGERAAREAEEFLRQGEPENENVLLSRMALVIAKINSWKAEELAFWQAELHRRMFGPSD